MKISKRTGGAVAALALAAGGLVATTAPAMAAGTWYLSLDGVNPISSPQAVTGSLNLQLQATYLSIPGETITCAIPAGTLSGTAPTTGTPSGGTLSIGFTLPTKLSSSNPSDPEYNRCTDTYSGGADDVTSAGGTWTLKVTMPATGSGAPSSLSGSLVVPQDDLYINSPVVPCDLKGPQGGPNVTTGNYNPSTGLVTASPTPQALDAYSPECGDGPGIIEDSQLNSASVQMQPIGGHYLTVVEQ
jgi:hypothetical protein